MQIGGFMLMTRRRYKDVVRHYLVFRGAVLYFAEKNYPPLGTYPAHPGSGSYHWEEWLTKRYCDTRSVVTNRKHFRFLWFRFVLIKTGIFVI